MQHYFLGDKYASPEFFKKLQEICKKVKLEISLIKITNTLLVHRMDLLSLLMRYKQEEGALATCGMYLPQLLTLIVLVTLLSFSFLSQGLMSHGTFPHLQTL